MNWIRLSILIQRFFFCAEAAAVAGSIVVLLILLVERFSKWKYSRLGLVWIKTAVILYLIPLAFVIVFVQRLDFSIYGIAWLSEFWHVSTSPMRQVYLPAACIWLLGLAPGIVFRMVQYRKLKYILKGNVPLEDENCQKLILQEEIECDIKACENSSLFTKKEYGMYLAGMEENQDDMVFASALSKSKKDLFRRLEGMVRGKSYKKRTAVISCIVLALIAVIPSYAASEGVVRLNEKWISATEVETVEELIDYKALEQKGHASEEEGVIEIDLTLEEETEPLGTEETLDRTINANTRVLYRWQEMKAGDTIMVSARCSDSSITYRIGIKDADENMTHVEGCGNLSHIFTIESDGSYTVYVENRSSKSMNVAGLAYYYVY